MRYDFNLILRFSEQAEKNDDDKRLNNSKNAQRIVYINMKNNVDPMFFNSLRDWKPFSLKWEFKG